MRSYRRRDTGTWLAGFAAALAGDQVFYLALTWAAAQVLTPVQVGLLLVAGSVPRAVVLLFGGVLVDRVGPKKVIIVSDSARTMVMVGAAVLLVLIEPGPLLLVVLAIVFGLVDGFFLPAVGAVPAFVAAPESMARLQALRSLIYRGAPVLGAAAGGWLVAAGSVSAAFAFNAGLFALSVTALALTRMVRPVGPAPLDPPALDPPTQHPPTQDLPAPDPSVPDPSAQSLATLVPDPPAAPASRPRALAAAVLGEAVDGLRTATSDPFLRVAVLVVTLLDLGLAGPMTAGPALVATARGWGAGSTGAILAAMPAGAAVCAAVLIVRRPAARAGIAIAAGAGLTALGLLGVGVAVAAGGRDALALAVGSSALVGVAVGVYGTMIHTALLQLSPTAQLGRIFALVALASYVGDPLSLAGTGALEQLHPGASFIVGSAVVAAAAVLAATSKPLRSVALTTQDRARTKSQD